MLFMNQYQQELCFWGDQEALFSRLKGKTILLSGSTGMVGKCLVDIIMECNIRKDSNIHIIALSRNEERARNRFGDYWDREEFQYVACDVNHPIPECGQADYLIHAASNTHPLQYSQDAIGTIASNVIGTTNLLNYAVAHDTKRICFLSSVEVYGKNRGDTEKFDEAYSGYIDCNTLRAGYPESKRLGEALCNAYQHTYGLDFVISRLSRIYGPTMLPTDSKAIAQFIKKAAAGEDIILKSEGNQKNSYTYVTDVAAAILYTLLYGKSGGAYNAADELSDITLKEMALYLAELAGSQVVFQLPDETERRGYSATTKGMLDASKLRKLGWRPRVHIQEGLCDTVEILKKDKATAK